MTRDAAPRQRVRASRAIRRLRITRRRLVRRAARLGIAAARAAAAVRRGAVAAWRAACVAIIGAYHLGLRLARPAAMVALVSLVLAGGAFAATRLYGEFGAPKAAVDARAWANRTEIYAVASCRACHAEQFDAKVAGLHLDVTCEACHGPQRDHPGSEPGILVRMDVPTRDACVTCHTQTAGAPIAFPTVTVERHYGGGVCVRCHDPHTIRAVAPPDVTHPLVNLPSCTTCHAPDGLKKVPAGHEMVADAVCLSCHARPQRTD